MNEKNNSLENGCKGIKILVVDDIPPNIMLVKEYLKILGCEEDYATNGLEAIKCVQANKYDLCLMDFQMPEMGGIEATKIIRETITKDMPIIALTGSATEEDLNEGLKTGMNDWLKKPIAIETLSKAILHNVRK